MIAVPFLTLAAAMFADSVRSPDRVRWFHGTDGKLVEGILRDGLKGRAEGGRGWTDPLPDRIYMTNDLRVAAEFALGTTLSPSMRRRFTGSGAIVELAIPGETSDVYPDEDWVGQMLAKTYGDALELGGWDWTNQPTKESLRGLPLDGRSDVGVVFLVHALRVLPDAFVDDLVRSVQDEPDDRRDFAIGNHARWGKRVIRQLERTRQGRALLAEGAHVAPSVSYQGPCRIVGVYVFDRAKMISDLEWDEGNLATRPVPRLLEVMTRLDVPTVEFLAEGSPVAKGRL